MHNETILCLSDSMEDLKQIVNDYPHAFFAIEQCNPIEYCIDDFISLYAKLKTEINLANVRLVIAEYVEAVILVYLMRQDNYCFPAIFIPHTNPYPVDIFAYFSLVRLKNNQQDIVLCGSHNAVNAYQRCLNIPAAAICTFGIKDIHFNQSEKQTSRNKLELPLDKKLLLYTGRLMDDKGLSELIAAMTLIKKEINDVQLVLSVTHIDPVYYNFLAPRLTDSILFYRLSREQLVDLYNACDLFVSCATSIYETYGKSQLEALACKLPVVVPDWDGFPHYLNDTNSRLAAIDFVDHPYNNPFQFAKVNLVDFADKCVTMLNQPLDNLPDLNDWARYSTTLLKIKALVDIMYAASDATPCAPTLTDCMALFMQQYDFSPTSLSLQSLFKQGIASRDNLGSITLRKYLHDVTFNFRLANG